MTVSELAELSNFSKAYISQVKNCKRPPSKKLLEILTKTHKPRKDYFDLFLKSREVMGVSMKTMFFYRERLLPFIAQVDYEKASSQNVEKFLDTIPPNHNGLATRHASFRAIKTFYRWLNMEHGLPNPIIRMTAPILNKLVLPSFSANQVSDLISKADNIRDKAIIALFTESGLRLSELANIKPSDIEWENKTIRIMGKGRKEAYAPFGTLSEGYMKQWLDQFIPNGNIWGLNSWGIISMQIRLKKVTGLPCNPHTFRRTFACLLRKQGIDTMTIKDLGRWESLEMVQRYTRSITFQDSMKFYKAPLSE